MLNEFISYLNEQIGQPYLVSAVNVHSVVIMDDYGGRVKGETYYHGELPVEE